MTKEKGSATLLMVFAAAVIAVFAIGSVWVGLVLVAREKANTAAEAGALTAAVHSYPPAGAGSPDEAAGAAVRDNGARLVRCRCPIDRSLNRRTAEVVTVIEVVVPFLGPTPVRGAARAEFDPVAWLGG